MRQYIGNDIEIWMMCRSCGAFVNDAQAFFGPTISGPILCGCGTYEPVVVMIPENALAVWDERTL